MALSPRNLSLIEEAGEFDRIRSNCNRPKNPSQSERGELADEDTELDRGEGLLPSGSRCPLRSPRPVNGVVIRLMSRPLSAERGIRIGTGLLLPIGSVCDVCEKVRGVVVKFSEAESVNVREQLSVEDKVKPRDAT